jgi:hypothetical protein
LAARILEEGFRQRDQDAPKMMFIKGIVTPVAIDARAAATSHTRSDLVEYEKILCVALVLCQFHEPNSKESHTKKCCKDCLRDRSLWKTVLACSIETDTLATLGQ